ncbi:efflux RND transporter periplasmic adaptor subunit [Persephonella sp.]
MSAKVIFSLLAGVVLGFGISYLWWTGDKGKSTYRLASASLPETGDSSRTGNQMFNVDTTVVLKRFISKNIVGYGSLVHPETDLKDITFKISGYVEEIYADFTGKYIKKGQPLLSIYSPELVSAQEEFIRAYRYYLKMKDSPDRVLKKSAEELYLAAYRRLRYWDITDRQIQRLKETGKPEKTVTLYSPYDGWVMEKFVNLGSRVKEGQPVMRLAKHKNLWLMVDIYEKDIPFVKKDLDVKVLFISYPEHPLEGKIDYIYPMMDEEKRTLKVRIVVDNRNRKYYPGMFGAVKVSIPLGKMKVLPETAVLDTGKRQYVFIQKAKGVFEPYPVKTGIFSDGYYQLIDGPPVGTVVANSSLFMLDADAQLKGKYTNRENKAEMEHMIHHHH